MTYLKIKILPVIACLVFFSQDVMAADTDLPDPFSQAVIAVRQKDYSTAYQLFLHLAEEGDYDAQYNLTIVKEPDFKTSYALRALAAAIGIRSAMGLRDEVEAELESKDLMDAQQMAAKLYEETHWPLPE